MVQIGEVVDAMTLSKNKLCEFFAEQIADTEPGVLFSLHLKATMMKVSDPIIFGHAVRLLRAFRAHESVFAELGVDPNNGVGDAYENSSHRQLNANPRGFRCVFGKWATYHGQLL